MAPDLALVGRTSGLRWTRTARGRRTLGAHFPLGVMNLLSPFHSLKDVRLMDYGKLRFAMHGEQMTDICLPGESILGAVRGRRGAQTQRLATSVLQLLLMTDHARFRVAWTKHLATTIRWQLAMIRVACPTTL